MSEPCRDCGFKRTVTRWQGTDPTGQRGGLHIRLECAACGAYIKFLPQTPDNVAAADKYVEPQQELFG